MINKLAILFQEKFKINFCLVGAKEIVEYPVCTMQVLEEFHSKFKRTKGDQKYKTIKTTIQFNFFSKKALEDLKFINEFTGYLNYDYKLDCDIECISYSNSRDLTYIESGTSIFGKSIDVTFNRFECLKTTLIDVNFVSGLVNGNNLRINKEE